jgi:hypothetical protein
MMGTPAWRALSAGAQALYPWLKLEWRGPQANNNGSIELSVRQAGESMGCDKGTAGRYFHDLQAKGFVVVREEAALGMKGEATSPKLELTELPLPGQGVTPRRLYETWSPGHDFPVKKAVVHNHRGGFRKQKPVCKIHTLRPQNADERK